MYSVKRGYDQNIPIVPVDHEPLCSSERVKYVPWTS